MITPTEKDIGRRVRLSAFHAKKGTLVDHRGCQACKEGCCCYVQYDRPPFPVPSNPDKLDWDDEKLL
jgi:hypothetical protein